MLSISRCRLDVGDGKEINLEKCPRFNLQHQCIKYLGPVSPNSAIFVLKNDKNNEMIHFTALLNLRMVLLLFQKERESYEVVIQDGKLVYKQNGVFVETVEGSKWIFVLSTTRTLYVGKKKKGVFQHSSFLSGGATTAAGRLVAHGGVLKAIWPYSGHYHPTEENFREFISFLEEHSVDLTNVKVNASSWRYTL